MSVCICSHMVKGYDGNITHVKVTIQISARTVAGEEPMLSAFTLL